MQIRRWFTSWSAKPISAMIKKGCDCVSQIPCSISPQTQPRTPFSFASVCAIATVGRWVKRVQLGPLWHTFTNHSPHFVPTPFLAFSMISGTILEPSCHGRLDKFLTLTLCHMPLYATLCHLMPPYATLCHLKEFASASSNKELPIFISSLTFRNV